MKASLMVSIAAYTAWSGSCPVCAQGPILTARELFYTPIAESKPVTPTKSAPVKQAVVRPKQTTQPEAKQTVKEESYRAHVEPKVPAAGNAVHYQTVAVTSVPLALRYSLLKLDEGTYREVDPNSIFRSGDKIRIEVESNDAGFLYIVQQGSSKTWQALFPNSEIDGGNNRIAAGQRYTLPGGARFTFDEQPGAERLFVILTRQPEPDIEKLIYSLSGAASPVSGEGAPAPQRTLMAGMRGIDDAVIDRIRGKVTARDLVFEKVDEDTPPPKSVSAKREKAMYVASHDRSPNARVIADLTLNHR